MACSMNKFAEGDNEDKTNTDKHISREKFACSKPLGKEKYYDKGTEGYRHTSREEEVTGN